MDTAIDRSANSPVDQHPNMLRRAFARRRIPILVAVILVALAARYAFSPRGPSAYERWFATLAPAVVQTSSELGDLPQAEPIPQEEIDIHAIGRVRGEAVHWRLRYLPNSKDERALRILELAREAEAFPASRQLGPDDVAPERIVVGAEDAITLIVSTKDGGFKAEFGPVELSKNVKLATMLRLFENFSIQDALKERY